MSEVIMLNENVKFVWDQERKTWCLCGTDNGLYWETDDVEASSLEEALEEALYWMEQDRIEEEYRQKYEKYGW